MLKKNKCSYGSCDNDRDHNVKCESCSCCSHSSSAGQLCILLNPYHPSFVKSALCILSRPSQHWGCTEAVLRLYWGCIEAVLRLYWGCTEVVLKLYWGVATSAAHTIFYVVSTHNVLFVNPLLRPNVMWKGIYLYSIRPPSTAGLLPVLETTTAGKWQSFHMQMALRIVNFGIPA